MSEAIQIADEQSLVGEVSTRQWHSLKAIFIAFLWIFALLSVWSAFAEPEGRLLAWALSPVGYWLLLAVHEMGHAVATWLVGWRVLAIGIGPLGYHFHNREFAFVPRSKRTEHAGFVLPVPTSAARCTVGRNIFVTAAGPAANLILAAGLFAAWWLGPLPGADDTVDPPLILLGIAVGSLALGIQSLLPSFHEKFSNDGDNIRTNLGLKPIEWSNERAIAYLAAALRYQMRLRDLPSWMIDEAAESTAHTDGDHRRYLETVLIGIVLDSPPVDVAEARQMLDEFRDRYGSSEWLDSCDAYFTAVWEGDAARARASLWRGSYNEEIKALMLAAEAAVLAREGRATEASQKLREMRSAIKKKAVFPDHTFRDIDRQIQAIMPA